MDDRIETQGPTWRAIRRRLNERIEKHRSALERDADELQTAKMRGRIAELRDLINTVEAENAEPEETLPSVPFA